MKLVSFNLKILMDETDRLCEQIEDTKKAANHWLRYQNERELYGSADQQGNAYARLALEQELMKLRERLAIVYDFQGDRGLANFEPTGLATMEDVAIYE